jgi:hypothetical protein
MGDKMNNKRSNSKDKYNENAYARYTIRIRKDSILFDAIEDFKNKKGTSLNFLVTKLLSAHFSDYDCTPPEV